MTLLAVAGPAAAQEITLSAGAARAADSRASSYAWSLSYQQDLRPHAFWTLGWLNEGHPDTHRRDGFTAQIWARAFFVDDRLALAFGAGPYRYYDTRVVEGGGGRYVNEHGFGALFSVQATWDLGPHWLLRGTATHVQGESDSDTNVVTAGLGYRLKRHDAPPPRALLGALPGALPGANELTLFYGHGILNSDASEDSHVLALEYRRRLGPYVEATATLLRERETRTARSTGAAAQLWARRGFAAERLRLGFGFGVYHALDTRPGAPEASDWARLVTLSAACDVGAHLLVRLSWDRIATADDQDSDLLLVGAGYRWD